MLVEAESTGEELIAGSLRDASMGHRKVFHSRRSPVLSTIRISKEKWLRTRSMSTRTRQTKKALLGVASAMLLWTVLAAALSTSGAPQRVSKRKMACKTPENAASCYWAHGRLSLYNGTPSIRLWKIGTNRVLAIHSGPGFKRGDNRENENPELPANVEREFKSPSNPIFADFEICPLEPEEVGTMQRACIESAKNIVSVDR
jgi:hypothetical protein